MISEKYQDENGEEQTAIYSCEFCHDPIERFGPDGIDYCPQCGCAEGFNNVYVNENDEEIEI